MKTSAATGAGGGRLPEAAGRIDSKGAVTALFPVLDTAQPMDGPGLESVIIPMEVLKGRSSRSPNYAAENRAMVELAQAMAVSPTGILQKLVRAAVELCQAHSAGISILDESGANFYWAAVAGQWACHLGECTPRDFGPCGTVLDRNTALVFTHPERYFSYLADLQPHLEEGLLVPLYIERKALGTIWAVTHGQSYRFDAEDLRLITSLAAFASSAYQTLLSLDRSNRRNAEQAALYQFTDRLYRATSPGDVHEAALDAITQALSCQRASILICDDAGVMRFVAWRGLSDEYRKAVDGHSPWTSGAKEPRPICIDDIDSADLSEELKAVVKMEGIRAVAFIPLVAKGELVGKFMTYYDAPHVFSEGEINLAVTIARQLGFSVERLRAEDAQQRAQERQNLLARELQHRTKNLFSVVQAVVARSCANKTTVKDAEAAIRERLWSLAQTHAIIADKEWQGADLVEVVRAEMSPYVDRVTIEGPSLMLTPQAAQNFTLALHELATNAAKYGALSNNSGHVRISWAFLKPDGHHRFVLRWQEHGGPPVTPPTRRGFGSAVLEQVMAEYFDNPPQIEFAPSGVSYELTGSLEALTG